MSEAGASGHLVLREANESDVALIVTFIHELAEYERLAEMCVADEAGVRATLFGADPVAKVVLAYWDGELAGYALFFRNYSTFLARPGIYLEDLFVRPDYRKRGIGLELLRWIARYAMDRDYRRVEWSVLKWNELAIDFYRDIGAETLDGWMTFRLSGEALARLSSP